MGLFKPSRIAHAHCHVPCGIYDPTFAQNAAETVVKMVEQLDALAPPGAGASAGEQNTYQQAVIRRVLNKEDHAKKVKYELLDVLWTQYFKPVHVERLAGPPRHVLPGRPSRHPEHAGNRHGQGHRPPGRSSTRSPRSSTSRSSSGSTFEGWSAGFEVADLVHWLLGRGRGSVGRWWPGSAGFGVADLVHF